MSKKQLFDRASPGPCCRERCRGVLLCFVWHLLDGHLTYGPTRQRVRQALIHLGSPFVRPSCDNLVELLDKLEGEGCDLEFPE